MVRSAVTADFLPLYAYGLHIYTRRTDPLRLLRRSAGRHGRAESSSSQHSRSSSPQYGESLEKLKRERSFKANRHHKFIECLDCEDVDMGSSSFLLLLIQDPSDA
jgi:hypothetical protein